MAKQTINIGTTANDGTGDPLRTAFDKVNDNFDELYTQDGLVEERARDALGTALTAGAGIAITVNDGADTITIARRSGTSFPGSPATGDLFYRTDRNIEYYYDGTRWLSVQLFELGNDSASQITGSTGYYYANMHFGVYSIYVEKFVHAGILTTSTPASNYFTGRVSYFTSSGETAIGSGLASSGWTQNVWSSSSETIGAVVPSAAAIFGIQFTETGTASARAHGRFTYRLVG